MKKSVFPHLHCAWLSGLIFILRSTKSLAPETFTLFYAFWISLFFSETEKTDFLLKFPCFKSLIVQ